MSIINPKDPTTMQDGIDPSKLPRLTDKQAQQLAQYNAERSRQMNEDNEAVDVNEYEMVAIQKLLGHLQTKYGTRSGTFQNLSDLKKEAEEKFREIGFVVQVDWIKSGLENKKMVMPEITVVRRLTEWDPELARFATGAGIADHIYDEIKDNLKKAGKYVAPPPLKK